MEIKIENVTKKIRKARVVDNVSMELSSGRVYGLKGINGSGKTMLMRLISGLIYPTEGQITIDGKVLGKDMHFPESIGLLIENPAFLDAYSGYDNLKLLASIREKAGEKKIREVLERVGLDPDSRKKYRKYSLGMKQRLGIAGAVLEEPDLLILGEPTNALDSDGVEMLKSLVQDERERGALVIVSCHDGKILEEMADEIYFLENGRVVSVENSRGMVVEDEKGTSAESGEGSI